jgi:Domain of unknown function (DUF4112)
MDCYVILGPCSPRTSQVRQLVTPAKPTTTGQAPKPAQLSLFIVHEAYQVGAPGHVIARMLGNVALDGVLGAMPLVGDAFDVLWRANRRNVRLLMEWLEHERRR